MQLMSGRSGVRPASEPDESADRGPQGGPRAGGASSRLWRRGRTPGFRDELSRALDLARLLLDDADRGVTSEDWFALSEHLQESA